MKLFLLLFFFYTFPFFFHSQTWNQLENFPGLERDDAVAFSIGEKAFLVTGNHNGFSESNFLWIYDSASKTWNRGTDFPGEKRQYATAFRHNEFAYLIGGISESNLPLNDVFRYNSITDSWVELDTFPSSSRWSAAGTVFGDSGYLFGGTTLTETLNDAWRFDFETEKWTALPTIPSVGKRDQLCFSIGEKIILSCGFSINPLEYHNETFSFDCNSQIWKQLETFPSTAIGYGTVANFPTKGIVLGGYREDGTFSKEAWKFENDSWEQLPDFLPNGMRGMSSFTINNSAYFLTGLNEDLTRSSAFYELVFEEENSIKFFPNPSTGKVNIVAPINSSLEIFNVLGEKISSNSFEFNNQLILYFDNVGVYFVQVKYTNGNTKIVKLMIV